MAEIERVSPASAEWQMTEIATTNVRALLTAQLGTSFASANSLLMEATIRTAASFARAETAAYLAAFARRLSGENPDDPQAMREHSEASATLIGAMDARVAALAERQGRTLQ